MAKKDKADATYKGTGRAPAKEHPRNTKKYRDETPRKDYRDYRKDVSPEKLAREKKARGEYGNVDTNNIHVLRAIKKHMQFIKPAQRKQPEWDQKWLTVNQKIKALEAGK